MKTVRLVLQVLILGPLLILMLVGASPFMLLYWLLPDEDE